MSTRNDLIDMNGTLGSRPTDWTNTSGESVLIVADETDPRVQATLAPRTGATMFGYDDRTGSGTEIDEFRRDFQGWELTAIAAGIADYQFFAYGGKDSTDGDSQYIGVEFFNSSNVSVGGPYYTDAQDYTQGAWNFIETPRHVIPTTATYAKCYLVGTASFSSALNCFWDDLSDQVSIIDPDASYTPQTFALVVQENGPPASSDTQGFTSNFAGLVVFQQSDPAEVQSSPQLLGLVVYEHGAPTGAQSQGFSAQLLGQVVWGQNVREQLNVRSWGFEFDGHEFIVYSFGEQGTYVYDDLTGRWSNWYTQGFNGQWNAEIGIHWYDGRYVAATIQDPTVVELDFDSEFDDGFRTIFRTVTGLVSLKHRDQNLEVGALHLDASVGAPSYTLPNPPGPRIGMRYSDDEGQTWTDFEYVSLDVGSYTQDVQWRSLGTIFAPGRIFEISDDGGVIRIDGATIDTRE